MPETAQTPLEVKEGAFHDEEGYWIIRGGSAFFQRKDVFHATDNSLSAVEQDTLALCETVLSLERRNAVLTELLKRYYTETPLGHQPHMIAHEVAAALADAQEGKQ